MFGSRHSCLEFRFRDGVRTLALHFLSLCECAVSISLGTAHSCPRVFCCVARSSCFYRLRAFMLYLVLCGTQLVYSLAACFHVVMSCVNTWLMSFPSQPAFPLRGGFCSFVLLFVNKSPFTSCIWVLVLSLHRYLTKVVCECIYNCVPRTVHTTYTKYN